MMERLERGAASWLALRGVAQRREAVPLQVDEYGIECGFVGARAGEREAG